jgi:Protein of unknown function (DUF2934)
MDKSKKPRAAVSASEPSAAVSTEELIRQRAYELYEQRGREDGHAIEDWLAGEAEVRNPKSEAAA